MRKETGELVAETGNKPLPGDLVGDIRSLIETARHNVAVTVNAVLTTLYWQIGNRIRQDILKEKRAEYGKEIVVTLSRRLTDDYGNNFNEKNLRRMIQFAEVFPDKEIVVTLSRQLSWSHFVGILPIKDDLQRDFYTEMCRMERWSVRTLRKKIGGMLYERTAISKKPEELVKKELAALEEKYDEQFKVVFDAIRNLMTPIEKPRKKIGFEPQKRVHSPWLATGLASESKNSKLPYGRRFPAACCRVLQ